MIQTSSSRHIFVWKQFGDHRDLVWSVKQALGSDAPDAPLLLVSLGPQADALENLELPKNAFCLPSMPQVDLLKSGVDLFLTHGTWEVRHLFFYVFFLKWELSLTFLTPSMCDGMQYGHTTTINIQFMTYMYLLYICTYTHIQTQ